MSHDIESLSLIVAFIAFISGINFGYMIGDLFFTKKINIQANNCTTKHKTGNNPKDVTY